MADGEVAEMSALTWATCTGETLAAAVPTPTGPDDEDVREQRGEVASMAQDAAVAERARLGDAGRPAPDWSAVADAAFKLLLRNGADADVAVRLMEALLRLRGWAGVTVVCHALRQWIGRDGAALRPPPRPDSGRFLRYRWLTGLSKETNLRLPALPLWNVPVLTLGGEPVGLFDLKRKAEQTQTSDRTSEEKKAESAAKLKTLEGNIARAKLSLAPAYATTWLADLDAARVAMDALDAAVRADLSNESEGQAKESDVIEAFAEFDRLFKEARTDAVEFFGDAAAPPAEASAADSAQINDDDAATVDAGTTTPPRPAAGRLSTPQTRAEAIKLMNAAAIYFDRHDPHSPCYYRVRRALEWVGLPLKDVVKSVMSDGNNRTQMIEQLWLERDNHSMPPPPEKPEFKLPAGPGAADRDDAARCLRGALAYLREQEPHSFAGIAIEAALNWINLPLEAVLKLAVTEDTAVLELMRALRGKF